MRLSAATVPTSRGLCMGDPRLFFRSRPAVEIEDGDGDGDVGSTGEGGERLMKGRAKL